MSKPKDQWHALYRRARRKPVEISYGMIGYRPVYVSNLGVFPVRRNMAAFYRRVCFIALDVARISGTERRRELEKARVCRQHAKAEGFKLP